MSEVQGILKKFSSYRKHYKLGTLYKLDVCKLKDTCIGDNTSFLLYNKFDQSGSKVKLLLIFKDNIYEAKIKYFKFFYLEQKFNKI